MRRARYTRLALLPSAALAVPAYAIGQPSAGAATTTPGGPVTMAVVLLVLIVAIGASVKLCDHKRRRDNEALGAQSFLTDVLLREFGPLPITAFVRGSRWWHHAPILLDIHGAVATHEQREAIMSVAARELARQYPSAQLENLVVVVDPLVEKERSARI